MTRTLIAAISLMIAAAPSLAHETEAHHHHKGATSAAAAAVVAVEPHRLAIQVNGVVCSFCAYGLEKALSKLDIIDGSQFTKGVFVEIEEQRVTLALQPAMAIDFADIDRRIKKAGYDAVRFDFRILGQASRDGERWIVAARDPAQSFALTVAPEDGENLAAGAPFVAQVHLLAEDARSASPQEPVPVIVDARF